MIRSHILYILVQYCFTSKHNVYHAPPSQGSIKLNEHNLLEILSNHVKVSIILIYAEYCRVLDGHCPCTFLYSRNREYISIKCNTAKSYSAHAQKKNVSRSKYYNVLHTNNHNVCLSIESYSTRVCRFAITCGDCEIRENERISTRCDIIQVMHSYLLCNRNLS